jgi:hypothetical protein
MKPTLTGTPLSPAVFKTRKPEQLVGVSLNWFRPGGTSSLAMVLLSSILQTHLAEEACEDGVASALGDTFVVVTVQVRDRKSGLAKVLSGLRETRYGGLPLLGLCEIAYYDHDEDFWRTVYPAGAPPFSRFLTPEVLQASDEINRREVRAFEELWKRVRALIGENPSV